MSHDRTRSQVAVGVEAALSQTCRPDPEAEMTFDSSYKQEPTEDTERKFDLRFLRLCLVRWRAPAN